MKYVGWGILNLFSETYSSKSFLYLVINIHSPHCTFCWRGHRCCSVSWGLPCFLLDALPSCRRPFCQFDAILWRFQKEALMEGFPITSRFLFFPEWTLSGLLTETWKGLQLSSYSRRSNRASHSQWPLHCSRCLADSDSRMPSTIRYILVWEKLKWEYIWIFESMPSVVRAHWRKCGKYC